MITEQLFKPNPFAAQENEKWAKAIKLAEGYSVGSLDPRGEIKGQKNDSEKPRMDLVPAGAVLETAKVFTFGAKKYAPHNWRKGFEYGRLIAALERHIAAFKEGEDTDPESGLPHMAHASCCVMMLIEHQLKGYGFDDRYTAKQV